MKRIISLITTMVLVWNIVAGAVITAAAEKANEHEYVYSDYSVLYTVVNEWSGYQSVEVKLTNTGEESLFGWGLKYDAGGTIDNIWDAKILSQNETEYIVKGESYARVLAPGKSASFGYVLSCDNPKMPEDIVLCNDWRTTENVEISFEITDDWTSSYQAVVTIANNGKSNVEAWKLAFSHAGNIKNLWTDDVLFDADGKALVVSSNSSAIIKKGESYTFSFIAEKDAEEPAELSDFVFTESYINTEKQPEKIEPLYVFGYSEFKDDELKILWYSSVEEGTFSVAQSKNNIDYKEIFSAEKTYEYTYGKVDFEKKYFKIIQTLSDGRSAESPVFIVKYDKEKGDCEVELLDSDEDGLLDVLEEAYGTDPMKKDTDEDGLTDYEEIYLTGTDPLVYNSVDESLSDAEADSDGDGLSNREELDLGTNPQNPDTDGDGLTDGEEVELGTDPLNPDMDGDGIPDGDEIKLKLDPTSDTTDGIKDSERTTEQEITADSEIMSQINTDENPMKVSIELEAAGLAETSLSVGESGYTTAISNSAVVGAIPEFTYTDGLSTGEVTVKFTADKSVRKNTVGTYAEDCDELKGIKRLNIFKYFEDTNILLPIETFHDEKNNTVYAKTDCLGTYCVMDLEVWLQNLEEVSDIMQEEPEQEEPQQEISTFSARSNVLNEQDENGLNVVFYLDTRMLLSENEFEEMKDLVEGLMHFLWSDMPYADAFIYTDQTEILSELPKEKFYNVLENYERGTNPGGPSHLLLTSRGIPQIISSIDDKKTAILVIANKKDMAADTAGANQMINLLQGRQDVSVSFISMDLAPKDASFGGIISSLSSGRLFKNFERKPIEDFLYTLSDKRAYSILTANNYELVKLDTALSANSGADTDGDGLLDWREVDVETIRELNRKTANRTYLLMRDMPTIQECITHYGEKLFYVEGALDRLREDKQVSGGMPSTDFDKYYDSYLQTTRITPIISNPGSVDSDEDGLEDMYDDEKLIPHPFSVKEVRFTPIGDDLHSSTICVTKLYNGDTIWEKWENTNPDNIEQYLINDEIKKKLREYASEKVAFGTANYPAIPGYSPEDVAARQMRDYKAAVYSAQNALDDTLDKYPDIKINSDEYYGLWLYYINLRVDYDAAGLLARDVVIQTIQNLSLIIPAVRELVNTVRQYATLRQTIKLVGGKQNFLNIQKIISKYGDEAVEVLQKYNNITSPNQIENKVIEDILENMGVSEKIEQSAELANKELNKKGLKDPYKPGTKTQLVTFSDDIVLVRTLNKDSNPTGDWWLRACDIEGLSPLEIKEKFALFVEPTDYVIAEIPAGSTFRVGIANSLFGCEGGGLQFEAYGINIDRSWIIEYGEF